MEYNYQKIKVLIQDEQDMFRQGIIYTLKFEHDCEIVGVAGSESLLEMVESKEPDVFFQLSMFTHM